jgi:putative ABC transport system permease protein
VNIWELVTVAMESVRSNKLRSFLTTLGIVIGIAAVISVVAIGQGGRAMLMKELESFGTNLFVIYVDYREGQSTHPNDLQFSDIKVIKDAVPEVKYMAPATYGNMRLRGEKNQKTLSVIGTNEDYANIRNLKLSRGRFLSSEDQSGMRKVIVIEEDTARDLFGSNDALGKQVNINGNSAIVVGILQNDTSQISFDSRQTAYIPLSFMDYINNWKFIHQFYGSATSKEAVQAAMDKSTLIMERRHNVPNHYVGQSMENEMQTVNNVTGIMSLIISCIAGISLLVGGIGVMNIMLVSVTERTREIGIRMALGARRKDILTQFLIESIVLCLLGGIIGTILGYGGAYIVAKIAHWPPLVSWGTVLIAFTFSACVGLFFGLYPANQAAKMNPIEALRRD